MENFKKWFGNSKVVDSNGEPLVVYHGTNQKIAQFDIEKSSPYNLFGKGFYFTDSEKIASAYLGGILNRGSKDSNVMPLYLKMEKPYDLREKISDKELADIQNLVKNNEYDFWFKYIYDEISNRDDLPWDDCSYEYINRKDIKVMVDFLVKEGILNKTEYLTRGQLYYILTDSIASKEVLKEYILSNGYDGMIIDVKGTGLSNNPMEDIEHNIYVAFKSNQIKHVYKNTNYDSSKNSIYEMKYLKKFNKMNTK